MKNALIYLHNDLYLEVLCILIFILSFCYEPINEVFSGYINILTSPSILLTDYVYISCVGSTFFNVATVLLFNILLIKILNLKINGPIYCGILMITGFSFFGKNIINTLPIYLGIFLYSKYNRKEFKNLIVPVLFSTGISPLISFTFFSLGFRYCYSIPLGIVVGIIVGFIIIPLSSHTLSFHMGYNLFNIGFALGIVSMMFYAIYIYFNLNVETVKLYDGSHSMFFYYLLILFSISSILLGLLFNKNVIKEYSLLLKEDGRLLSDFITKYSIEVVLLNVGIIGLFTSIIGLVFGIKLNGILFGSILSILGCASFGVHIKNLFPIWLGGIIIIIIKLLIRNDFMISPENDISMIMAFIFSAGLSPISKKYGFINGVIVGIMHIVITPLMISLQGGFDLYNNGFSAGFGAMIIVATNNDN